ncbi:hypothetical protein A2468_04195 [Candidatus Falkowbacteria bacterium RIFOXYC2_FULL_46_15]|uniref:50S ribosomal protein L7/L12 n=1 Tax=Candidatus Falkowbacteria bacterium RIFOXYA2_FULL_47_19 TaxID=1797994 RepID=A0A1F5SMT0_9BACT|nr:MAG: hypothetical protein A2227_05345 [Candidatus Falkowbacteria bacterium RIFOXYA2_FULL_47_19]OGF35155.1 MAG: hypothetical protein A2468_04195 [Candidatus Falkowbacteria bacterium RIFOXYC2_FULL_46_15]
MSKTNLKNKEQNSGDMIDDLELSMEGKEEEPEKKTGQGKKEDGVLMSRTKIALAKKLLENIRENNDQLIQLLAGTIGEEDEARLSIGQMSDDSFVSDQAEAEAGRVIEGVFDGENMIGPDGKQYSVPANYASKSKLVEGDILKLTITPSGTFVYKQIGPIERSRVIGKLEQNDTGSFIVISEGKKWRVLTASVTYYKGKSGDEVVILVPKAGQSQWAAVDNIVRSKF